jgi:hypothetical protein
MDIPLRAGADGPPIGLPPLIATPNIASIVGYFHGASVGGPTELVAVDTLVGGMDNRTIAMRAGCRYLVEMHLSCGTKHDATLSRIFQPTYATKPSGGAFPALNAMHLFQGYAASPTTGATLWVGAANETTVTAYGHGNLMAAELVIPTVDQVGIQFGVRIGAVVAGYDFVIDYNCWAQVFELGGIP